MSAPRILVWDIEPPSECIRRLMAALKTGTKDLRTMSQGNAEVSITQGAGEFRTVLSEFDPHVIMLLLRRNSIDRAQEILEKSRDASARPPVIALLAGGGQDHALALLRAGAEDFILPPLRTEEVIPRVWKVLANSRQIYSSSAEICHSGTSGLIGKNSMFMAEVERLPRIAGCNASVLISGETGTGKELFARAIHDLSPRAKQPFVPLNCGAIPAELAESELFGHERGAFTSAHAASRGVIREAEGGTLFLDEVTSLSLPLQVKLLRFLQEKEVRPVGSDSLHRVDVRIIAAADHVLEAYVREGRFRRDLYYRLNTIPICLPPLRERREDIPLLTRFFLERFCGHLAFTFSNEALQKLLVYDWPGNVRELEHVVERSLVLSPDRCIRACHVTLPKVSEEARPGDFRTAKSRIIWRFEHTYLEDLLSMYHGNISRAAKAAGKNRRALWELIRKHGISVEHFREEADSDEAKDSMPWG